MFVLVNGLPYFGKKLVEDLNFYDKKHKYLFLNTYYSKIDKLLFFILLPISRLVISFNGVSDYSGTLNWTLRWRKKMIMQWQGSDVMIAKERFLENKILLDYINISKHVTDFGFLQNELKEIGIDSDILPFKHLQSQELTHSYQKISVLTYIGQNNELLYGLNEIIEAANTLNEIEFHVIGMRRGEDVEYPPNLIFHGWKSKNEVNELMKSSSIFLRMTKHDGNALSVTEALIMGCEVIWTYPSENTHLATNSTELIDKIISLKKIIELRNMKPNFIISKKISDQYNRDIVIPNYVKYINSIL